jgi:NADPH-dependent curcumin reductase CurA
MYAPPIQAGQPVTAGILGEVVVSKSQKYKKGDKLTAMGSWSEYATVQDDAFGVAPAA